MSPFGCIHEREVGTLLQRGQWPQASPQDLLQHAKICRACTERITVHQALQHERTDAMAQPRLPSPSAIWWRAQLRKRNQAIERISRPILGAEIFAFFISAVVGVCGFAWALRRGIHPTAWLGALHFEALRPDSLPNLQGSLAFDMILLAAVALVGGVLVYFASEKS